MIHCESGCVDSDANYHEVIEEGSSHNCFEEILEFFNYTRTSFPTHFYPIEMVCKRFSTGSDHIWEYVLSTPLIASLFQRYIPLLSHLLM